jgi:hypothetical protein
MGWLAPAFLAGLLAVAVPVVIHMINRERKETVAFPSLMFLRKIPYRSVRRQKLRHLALLAMRCLAILLVVAAFARPFLSNRAPSIATGADGREVVIVLDRSYSMAHGGRWTRALNAARTIAGEMRAIDRVSIVTFGTTASQVVEPTAEAARVNSVLSTLQPTSEPTRYAAGLRMAGQLLGASQSARKEVILISDFHRFGWSVSDEVALPTGVAVRTIDVSRAEKNDVAVASVAVARAQTGDRARATVTARAMNLGEAPRTVEATLDFAGRRVDARRVTVPPRSSAQIVFAATPVTSVATRGVVQISADSQPSNDAFHFVVAEETGASALIVEPSPRGRQNQSLFLSRALSVADDPPVRVETKTSSTIAPVDLRGRTLIVLNESELPTGTMGNQLRVRVSAGSMLFIVPGERNFANIAPEWRALLPASVGPVVERGGNGRWASVDFSNALFEPFRSARADFSSVAISRYRALEARDSSQVIARLDDGAPLLVEKAVGSGRVLLWAGTLDAAWNDLPFHPLFVPLVHQLARRSLAGRESRAWFTAPHALDLGGEGNAVVEAPSGNRTRLFPDSGRSTIELRERGFYEVRSGSTAIGAGRPIAVNVDLAESDLSHMDPAELVAAVTARGTSGTQNAANAPFTGTAEELERRQAIWWYLLLAAMILLAAETLLSNRLSRRSLDQPVTGVS